MFYGDDHDRTGSKSRTPKQRTADHAPQKKHDVADDTILQAEQFKAQITAPKGKD